MPRGTTFVRRPAGMLVAAALLLAGCGTGSDLGTSTDAHAHGTVRVVMQSLDFSPLSVHAKVGQTVQWINDDQAPHNVTYVSGPRFKSSRPTLNIGEKFSITLRQPGTIHYVCTLHSWMKATIVVSG